MRFYLSYFKLRFITALQYRTAAIAGLTTQFFFGIVFIMVYVAFYESKASVLPMQLNELVSYLWLNQAFFALINLLYNDTEIINLIKTGDLAYELARPKQIYPMWYAKIIGQRLAMVTLRAFPVLIITMLLPEPYNLGLPVTLSNFILFLITLVVGALLMTAIVTLYHILMLYTLDEKGITNIFIVLADILSGLVVPIPFFPDWLQKITTYLPFRYVSDLPFRLYTGNISIYDGIIGLIVQLTWLLITITISYALTKKTLKRIVVQGG